jgi:gluconokinase
LKESYRATLAAGMPENTVKFVLLDAPKELIAERLAHRKHEYMTPKLLDSQLATLEKPKGDSLVVENDRAPEQVVDDIVEHVQRLDAAGPKVGA